MPTFFSCSHIHNEYYQNSAGHLFLYFLSKGSCEHNMSNNNTVKG